MWLNICSNLRFPRRFTSHQGDILKPSCSRWDVRWPPAQNIRPWLAGSWRFQPTNISAREIRRRSTLATIMTRITWKSRTMLWSLFQTCQLSRHILCNSATEIRGFQRFCLIKKVKKAVDFRGKISIYSQNIHTAMVKGKEDPTLWGLGRSDQVLWYLQLTSCLA